ncbi:iron chelate uptake ABC transporter family permease subunit [Bacillus mangrovi]|uniref:Iron chelate uptake ABC transporter family permease subunit n=1 Tax=Metabacillus mangrovi TaxID=1491830 RepID=A0A7X2V5S6_9BACI|nr:iron ABC transporter permease [Metabacillus mangrovi]MTH54735.1 iron chelate uptake ABC transporter family permease subunit [Metabacillus mangrovi]
MAKSALRSLSFALKLAAALLLLAAMFAASMIFGAADVTLKDVWLALSSDSAEKNITILREIRLPREIGAAFVGAALAVSGAIMQGMTRNPLADPGLLGLSAGAYAALAVVLALFDSANYLAVMAACFTGAGIGAVLVFGISSIRRGGFSPLRIVLGGAAISAFLYAIADGVKLYFKVSKNVTMWTSGGLIGTNWNQLQIIIPVILAGLAVSILLSRQLTILSLNEEVSIGLGQKTRAVKAILFLTVILLTGSAVALAGNLVFLGLMIPHIVRPLTGNDYRFILPMSAVAGAIFMLFADTAGRTLNAPFETPVAAIVAMLGLPFFLLIVRKGGNAIR